MIYPKEKKGAPRDGMVPFRFGVILGMLIGWLASLFRKKPG